MVEEALNDIRFDHENVKQGNKFAKTRVYKIYSWIIDQSTIQKLIEAETVETIIDNVPIIVEGNNLDKLEVGYSLEDKKIHILVYSLLELVQQLPIDAIFHELIHYYHDIILKADTKKEYNNAEKNPKEYYNSIEELSTYYSELIDYISNLIYELVLKAQKNNEKVDKNKIINIWLPMLYTKINTDPKYKYFEIFTHITLENKKMLFDKLLDYFDKNLVESTSKPKCSKEVLNLIKQWEADPEAQKRWREAGRKAAKIKNSPYWRTHPQDYMQESFKSVEEIYQDLNESE